MTQEPGSQLLVISSLPSKFLGLEALLAMPLGLRLVTGPMVSVCSGFSLYPFIKCMCLCGCVLLFLYMGGCLVYSSVLV